MSRPVRSWQHSASMTDRACKRWLGNNKHTASTSIEEPRPSPDVLGACARRRRLAAALARLDNACKQRGGPRAARRRASASSCRYEGPAAGCRDAVQLKVAAVISRLLVALTHEPARRFVHLGRREPKDPPRSPWASRRLYHRLSPLSDAFKPTHEPTLILGNSRRLCSDKEPRPCATYVALWS